MRASSVCDETGMHCGWLCLLLTLGACVLMLVGMSVIGIAAFFGPALVRREITWRELWRAITER